MAKSGEKKKRYDRATNELIMLEFINKYVKKNGGYPSLEAIKKGVSNYMSKRTVDRIISEIDLLDVCKNHPSKLKLNELINKMCEHGLNGNIPAGRLWLAFMFGWNEKKVSLYEPEGPMDYGEKLTQIGEILRQRFNPPDKYNYSNLTAEELRILEKILNKVEKATDNTKQKVVYIVEAKKR